MADGNEGALRAVISAWGESGAAAQAAIRRHFADDCVWEQPGLPTTTGPDEAAGLISWMDEMGFSAVDVEYRNVAAVADVVFTERIDWLVRADGSRVGPFPVVGVTEFRDGKISAWREYFDTAVMAQLMGGDAAPA
jgi:limonene-1,2-epoxide hydrolase